MDNYDEERKNKKTKQTMDEIEKAQADIARDMGISLEDVFDNQVHITDLNEVTNQEEYNTMIDKDEATTTENMESHTYDDYYHSDIHAPNTHISKPLIKVQEAIKPSKKGTSFKQKIAMVVVAALIGGPMVGLSISAGNAYFPNKIVNPPEETTVTETVDKESISLHEQTFSREGFADIIAKADPFVVNIQAKKEVNTGNVPFNMPNESTGSGSGILFKKVDNKYYIITNSHVISGSSTVSVSVEGSSLVPANLVGKNETADLAVISIEESDLKKVGIHNVTLATFGDSDTMRVGDFVLAIGNSMGEGNTATNGMISAKDKEITTDRAELSVLQTNAAINPGNSGGPLINLEGEVIGITTAKMADVQQSIFGETGTSIEGMGYAIPSNIAMEIVEELMTQKERPALGITIYNMTEEYAQQYNLPQAGAIVQSVEEGSAAAVAGIEAMDVITGYDGKSIMSAEQLIEAVKESEVGDTVEIKIITSQGEAKTVKVKLKVSNQTRF